MQLTKINPKIQSSLITILDKSHLVCTIVQEIDRYKGSSFLVGGAVRDHILGRKIKDLDIEIHGLSLEQVQQILATFGAVHLVGKSFGVLRINNLDVDWSLPRIDSTGRKPEVKIDPFMGINLALRRRDLTMNAMAIDLISYELLDPFGGLADIEARILRTPDGQFFVEDPLRFYRVMQFVGRFDMEPDGALNALCATMDLTGISKERISDEFEKLFLQSKRPSLGLRWVARIKRIKQLFPELGALIGVPQDHSWHPEGDVFEHTMQAVDAAAVLSYKDDREKLIIMFAALCHDLGKAVTTEYVDDHYKSAGHAQESARLARRLLKRITIKTELVSLVVSLVENHMHVLYFTADNAGPQAYKRLARKLSPELTLENLALLALADSRGRNAKGSEPLTTDDPGVTLFYERARQCTVLKEAEPAIVHGRDFLAWVAPGRVLGDMVRRAYEIQIDLTLKDKQKIIDKVLEEFHGQMNKK